MNKTKPLSAYFLENVQDEPYGTLQLDLSQNDDLSYFMQINDKHQHVVIYWIKSSGVTFS